MNTVIISEIPHELQSLRDSSVSGTDLINANARRRHSGIPVPQTDAVIGSELVQSKIKLFSRFVKSTWTFEILSWLFGALTLAILIVILATFNKRPLRDWKSSITVNTLINALTTIASTALIFPIASSIAQLRWIWLQKKERVITDLDSFSSGPLDVFFMVYKHSKM